MCTQCDFEEPKINDVQGYVLHFDPPSTTFTSQWLENSQHRTRQRCPECSAKLIQSITYNIPPKLLLLEHPRSNLKIEYHIKINNDPSNNLHLKGIVYHEQFHFTFRGISEDNNVWYNDGRITGKNCIDDGKLNLISNEKLNVCRNRNIIIAVYA